MRILQALEQVIKEDRFRKVDVWDEASGDVTAKKAREIGILGLTPLRPRTGRQSMVNSMLVMMRQTWERCALPSSEDMIKIAMDLLTRERWPFFEQASVAIKEEVPEAKRCGEAETGGVEPMQKMVVESIKRVRAFAAEDEEA